MLEYDFRVDPCYWLHMSAHRITCAANAELLAEGLTYRQAQVLALLALEGVTSQTELAQRMRVQPPTVVQVLDRMEREGLVTRSVDTEDRRRRLVAPTEKAIPVWERIVRCFRTVRAKYQAGLSAEEVETLIRLLQRTYANLDDVPLTFSSQITEETDLCPAAASKTAAVRPPK